MIRTATLLKNVLRTLRTTTKRKNKTPIGGTSFESLEQRQVMSVTNPWFSGAMLVVPTDSNSTHVTISSSAGNVLVKDVNANRTWTYAASGVSKVEFQGGSGNDRFVNYICLMPIRAYGGAGNDYLEGYNGADVFVGGAGNDELVGYGGNDQMWGGDGNDILRGDAGLDDLYGEAGNDRLMGESDRDRLWGGMGNDVLLGGSGNDDLVGEDGNDQLNGQADLDRLWGGNGDDVLIAIDSSSSDYLQSDNGRDVLWVDKIGSAKDQMYGNTSEDKVQEVASFANGADRTLNGDRISDPSAKSGQTYRTFSDNPLFSSAGPALNDTVQGALANCYFIAGLGAVAMDSPQAVRQNIVDFHDGTYGVRLGSSFYRVDNDLPVTGNSSTPSYAQLGAENSMWVAIAEKAFAYYRRGQNSYASIEWGWSVEVNRAFGTTSAGDKAFTAFSNAAAMAAELYSRWNNYGAVTVGFGGDDKKAASNTTPLILSHAYVVKSFIRNSAGIVTSIVLRNPWGRDGGAVADSNPNDALVTVTPDQLWTLRSVGRINWGRV